VPGAVRVPAAGRPNTAAFRYSPTPGPGLRRVVKQAIQPGMAEGTRLRESLALQDAAGFACARFG